MYCGICVEVCPFDALFWTPEFEYAEYSLTNLIHEKERLEEWTYTVLPPPALEVGAVAPVEEVPVGPGAEAVEASGRAGLVPAALPDTPKVAEPEGAAVAPTTASAPEQATPNVAAAGEKAVAPTAAGSHGERVEVEPDNETYERVLAEQLAAGKDRRVAEGQAKRAAMLEARRKAGGG
jgi:NADH-quinone oxidoreductase subunit I